MMYIYVLQRITKLKQVSHFSDKMKTVAASKTHSTIHNMIVLNKFRMHYFLHIFSTRYWRFAIGDFGYIPSTHTHNFEHLEAGRKWSPVCSASVD